MKHCLFFLVFSTAICCYTRTIAQASSITWQQLDSMASNMHEETYFNAPDTALKLFYLQPANIKPDSKLPAIIWIHGGAWVGGKANTFFANAAYCALKGAVGISLEYRLINQPQSSIYNCITDCQKAIAYIKANALQLHIDTAKLVFIGESAGGHLAACLALLDSTNTIKPAALVLYNPVLNVATGTFIKYMRAEATLQKNKPVDTTSLLTQYQSEAKTISPLYLVKKKLPPTLILNGTVDKITPYEYAVAFADSLKTYNTKHELVLLPNLGHAFAIAHYKSTEQQVIDALLQADKFLTKLGFLKGNVLLVNGNDGNWLQKH
jgi:acetyl esterase/lipase